MTEIAKELLEGVNINDRVKIRYGTSESQDLAEGTVVRISENFLSLQKSDGGVIRIRLDDSLRSLEVVMQTQTAAPTAAAPAAFQILKQTIKLGPAPAYNFSIEEWLGSLKELVKNFDDAILKNGASSIVATFETAARTNNLGYKYHDIRAKILSMWSDCDSAFEYEFFYQALGILAVAARDYDYALEPLTRAKKYELAAYAAELALKDNYAEVFKICALLSGDCSEITQDVAEICVKRKDVEILLQLLEMNSDNDAACEKIFTCAVGLFKASGGSLTENIARDETAYVAAKKILARVPDGWKNSSTILQRWDEYSSYSYPKPAIRTKKASEKLTGRIYSYKPNRNFGFISPNHYFHVKQIFDNTDGGILLRKILALGLWNQLEVSFKLGKSITNPNQSAASNIELTAEGIAEAQRRLREGEGASTGFIEAFFPQHQDGRIICNEDGQSYKFNASDIVDPWLRAYYERGFSRGEQAVEFKIVGLDKAVEIRWKDPAPEDYDAYSDFVDEYSMRAWERFLAEQNSAPKNIPLPDEDPYRMYFYCSLPEWTGGDSDSKSAPLTWNLKDGRAAAPKPVAEPVNFTPRGNFADKGRRAVVDVRFEEAEKNFQSALQAEGYSEAVFNDLISLYVRWDGKTDKALELIERYGIYLTKDKLLNAKIRVYERRRDYEALTNLYEDGIKNTTSVAKQSHYLVALTANYWNLKNYEAALQACRRWENLYQQNQFSAEYDKLRSIQPVVNRRKATCLYYLGRTEEARAIAKDLMRVNPVDEVAVQIMRGDFAESDEADGDNLAGRDFILPMIEAADGRAIDRRINKFGGDTEDLIGTIER